jgi:hypothetical protein
MSANCARRIYTILPRRHQGDDRTGVSRSGVLEVSDDRLMQILQTLAVLLFVSVGALALGRARPAWVRWAKWGSIAIFTTAVMYALVLTLRWALNPATD